MFVIKYEPPPERHICFTPPQTENNPLVPGDIWRCDCEQHHIWLPVDTSKGWRKISDRKVNRQIKRFEKGKPFKQACGHSMGPG